MTTAAGAAGAEPPPYGDMVGGARRRQRHCGLDPQSPLRTV